MDCPFEYTLGVGGSRLNAAEQIWQTVIGKGRLLDLPSSDKELKHVYNENHCGSSSSIE